MAIYDLERCSIFLVEDNSYVRNILADMLRYLKFGTVTTAEDGADAIEYLKTLRHTAGGFDFIVSDLVMSPNNGLLLLRWVRTSKESPNRFMPFIMLSGAADAEYVNAARDLGVTEFLAKPFSATSVYRKMLEVIDRPRQFVTTQSYFGPDRRRKRQTGYGGTDRRTNSDADVTVVYSADKVVKATKPTDVWYFRLQNALKEKVGGLGATGGGELPVQLLADAEKQLERAALDFTDWAANYIAQLARACKDAQEEPPRRAKLFEEINLLAHELRGQGGTFGYPLISSFAKMLYDCTGEGCRTEDNDVEVVKAHIDSMRAVLREKVAGDGGDVGRALHAALKQAIERHTAVQ